MIRFILLLALSAFSVTGVAAAQPVEVAFEEDRGLPMVDLNIAIRAGSAQDPSGQSGITNFMGEMLLRGTRSRNKEGIDLALDQMGARLSVETRTEAMIIRGSVLAAQLEPFLKLLGEILLQPVFPEIEIRKLKSEIVSGILEELGNDSSLANRRFNRFLFENHPYGNPVLGKVKDVERLSREKILAHYQRLVRRPLLLVVGAGDTTPERIRSWAEEVATAREKTPGLPAAAAVEKAPIPKETPSRRLIVIDKPERTQTQIYGGQLGVRMTDPRFFPLYLGNYAFGGGSFSARMMVEIRVKRGWSYGANSYFRHGLQPRSWQFHLFPASKDAPAALEYSLKMVSDLRENGIKTEEFDFAQRSLVKGAGFMYDTPKKRVENTLLERTLDLPEGFMKSYGPELSKVKLEEVNSALKNFIHPERLTLVVLGTASELKEPLAKAAGLAPEKAEIVPYTQE